MIDVTLPHYALCNHLLVSFCVCCQATLEYPSLTHDATAWQYYLTMRRMICYAVCRRLSTSRSSSTHLGSGPLRCASFGKETWIG